MLLMDLPLRPKNVNSTMLTTEETPNKEVLNSISSNKSLKSLLQDYQVSTTSSLEEADQEIDEYYMNNDRLWD